MENRSRHKLFVLKRIILSKLYRVLGPANTYLQPKKRFSIKAGYHEGGQVESFDDRSNTDQWQRQVYESALSLFQKKNCKSVIDVGCGSAYKLIDLFGIYETTGIELSDTYYWLTTKYPDGKWLSFEMADPLQLRADMIICSDVIEHIKNPDELMDFLKKIQFRFLVLSTPERNSVRGSRDYGPPQNPAHYREWNDQEFKEYVSRWFAVQEQVLSNDQSVSQVLFCAKRQPA